MRSSKSTGNAAAAYAPALLTLQRQLRAHPLPALARLRAVRSTITTSALALRHQNADADADVARVLVHSAAGPLDAEIERLETFLHALQGRAPKEPSSVALWRVRLPHLKRAALLTSPLTQPRVLASVATYE